MDYGGQYVIEKVRAPPYISVTTRCQQNTHSTIFLLFAESKTLGNVPYNSLSVGCFAVFWFTADMTRHEEHIIEELQKVYFIVYLDT